MVPDLPCSPLGIELRVSHHRFWWQTDIEDELPEQWHVSADISALAPEPCPKEFRHVGDIDLLVADLTPERNLLDSAVLDDWALEFLSETIVNPNGGKLHPELDRMIQAGPPRLVILRRIEIGDMWRGHGLGAALLGGALRIMAPNARLAACRVSSTSFPGQGADRMSRELLASRFASMLKHMGFTDWHGVHVLDIRDPKLLDTRLALLDQWWPKPGT